MSSYLPSPFHLAFPVHDLDKARYFYMEVLGCTEGRSAPLWVDFNFYGHQISAHLRPEALDSVKVNPVDGDAVPVRHFGLILPWDQWEALSARLKKLQWSFRIDPKIRFLGQKGEQGTFFVDDPSGNCLEFKTFRDTSLIFAS